MNKSQLVDRLAERTGLSRAQAREAVNAIFDPSNGVIAEVLREGGSVAFSGFARFSVRDTPARVGRDPRTGQELQIPARRACSFQPRKGLRSSMKDMVGA